MDNLLKQCIDLGLTEKQVKMFVAEYERIMDMDALLCVSIPILIQVESGGQPNPDTCVGDGGKSVGCLQMHKICVDDVNRISGRSYTYEDRLSREKSIEMCKIYLKHYATEKRLGHAPTMKDCAMIWNGGPNGYKKAETLKYWEKVRKQLQKGK